MNSTSAAERGAGIAARHQCRDGVVQAGMAVDGGGKVEEEKIAQPSVSIGPTVSPT
jgi:hypothetical protein